MNSPLSEIGLMTVAASAASIAVLALRTPLRRLIGPSAAYGLWLTVPIAMGATLLPPPVAKAPAIVPMTARPTPLTRLAEIPRAAEDIAWPVEPTLSPVQPVAAAPIRITLAQGVVAAWLAGALLTLLLTLALQRRAMAQFGVLARDPRNPRLMRASHPATGPALVGLLFPRVIVPADFERRFAPREQAVILAHEQAHLSAGHLWINGVATLILALNWFNPLIHLASLYARIDQELACDAAVLARFPNERRTYAEALVKTQIGTPALPLGCSWPAVSPNLLKERIELLAAKSRRRRLPGALLVAALTTSAGVAAWAAQAPRPATTAAPAPLIGGPASRGLSAARPDGAGLGAAAAPTAVPPQQAFEDTDSGATTIEEAIAAGDIQRVVELGGQPADAIAAMRVLVARDPAAKADPGAANTISMVRFLRDVDDYTSYGYLPTFVNTNNGRNFINFVGPGGSIPGTPFAAMNKPGAPPVGLPSSSITDSPDMVTLYRNILLEMRKGSSLEEAIATGSNQGIRYYGGTVLDMRMGQIAMEEANRATALSLGRPNDAASIQRQIDGIKADIAMHGDEYANQSAGPYVKNPTTPEELAAMRAAGLPDTRR